MIRYRGVPKFLWLSYNVCIKSRRQQIDTPTNGQHKELTSTTLSTIKERPLKEPLRQTTYADRPLHPRLRHCAKA